MKENGPLFEDVAGEWWETHSKNIKTGAERAYKGSYKAALEEFSGYRMKEITPAVVSLWPRPCTGPRSEVCANFLGEVLPVPVPTRLLRTSSSPSARASSSASLPDLLLSPACLGRDLSRVL